MSGLSIPDMVNLKNALNSMGEWMGNGKPLNTLLEHTHAQFVNMQLNNVRIVDILVGNSNFTSFTIKRVFLNMDHLLQLHCNLDSYRFIMRLFSSVMLVLTLVVGVNINKIFTFIDVKLNAFYKFINYIIKQCSGYYDAVRDCARNPNRTGGSSQKRTNINRNSKITKKKKWSDKGNNSPVKNLMLKSHITQPTFTTRDLAHILRYIRNRLLAIRLSNVNNPLYPLHQWYGSHHDQVTVTLRQILCYAIMNPNEICDWRGFRLIVILSPAAQVMLSYSLNTIWRSREPIGLLGIFAFSSQLQSYIGNGTNIRTPILIGEELLGLLEQLNLPL